MLFRELILAYRDVGQALKLDRYCLSALALRARILAIWGLNAKSRRALRWYKQLSSDHRRINGLEDVGTKV